MNYGADQSAVLKILKSGNKCCLMAAPSFPVDFDYKTFVSLMKSLGFDKVVELTFGAKIVNKEYRDYINNNLNQEKFITTVCPLITNLIINQFPDYKKYLLPFDSPMVSMAKIIKHLYPDYAVVFLSPCTAKKLEAKESKLIDACVTFKELKELIINEDVKNPGKNLDFESFHNEYTKIYPLGGGLAKTMQAKKVFKKKEILSCDDCKKIKEILSKPGIKFFDLLFCKGGCIGGNGIANLESTAKKKKKIIDYKNYSEKEVMGKKRGLIKNFEGLDFKRRF